MALSCHNIAHVQRPFRPSRPTMIPKVVGLGESHVPIPSKELTRLLVTIVTP